MYLMTKTNNGPADLLRAALVTAGITRKQVTVRHHCYSMGSHLYVTVRDSNLPVSVVEKIAASFESVRHCEATGEILSGGNRHLTVERHDDHERLLATPIAEALAAAEIGFEFEVQGVKVVKIANTINKWNNTIRIVDVETGGDLDHYCSDLMDVTHCMSAAKKLVEVIIERAWAAKHTPADASCKADHATEDCDECGTTASESVTEDVCTTCGLVTPIVEMINHAADGERPERECNHCAAGPRARKPAHNVEQSIPVLAPSDCRPLAPFPTKKAKLRIVREESPVEDWAIGI
jgi:hypothetical protein